MFCHIPITVHLRAWDYKSVAKGDVLSTRSVSQRLLTNAVVRSLVGSTDWFDTHCERVRANHLRGEARPRYRRKPGLFRTSFGGVTTADEETKNRTDSA